MNTASVTDINISVKVFFFLTQLKLQVIFIRNQYFLKKVDCKKQEMDFYSSRLFFAQMATHRDTPQTAAA